MRMLSVLILGAAVMRGCIMGSTICTAQFVYGINIAIVDSATGSPPSEATLLATSGTYTDSVGPRGPYPTTPPVLMLSTAGERAGVYSVTVRSPGYRDWTRTGIRVTADECHVKPVILTALLQPN